MGWGQPSICSIPTKQLRKQSFSLRYHQQGAFRDFHPVIEKTLSGLPDIHQIAHAAGYDNHWRDELWNDIPVPIS